MHRRATHRLATVCAALVGLVILGLVEASVWLLLMPPLLYDLVAR